MPITVSCECGAKFRTQDEHAGKLSRCPKCGTHLRIPKPATPSQDPEPAANKEAEQPPSSLKSETVIYSESPSRLKIALPSKFARNWRRGSEPGGLFILLAITIPLAIVCLVASLGFEDSSSRNIFILVAGFFWLLFSAGFYHRTSFSISETSFILRRGPLPWPRTWRLRCHLLKQLFMIENHGEDGSSYTVWALLKNNQRRKLVTMGTRSQAKEFLQKIHDFLGIEDVKDVPVSRVPRFRTLIHNLPVFLFCSFALMAGIVEIFTGGTSDYSTGEFFQFLGGGVVILVVVGVSGFRLAMALFGYDEAVNEILKEGGG